MTGFVSMDLTEVRALASTMENRARFVPQQAARIVAAGGQRVVAAIQQEIQRLDLIDTGDMLNTTGVDVNGLAFEAGPTVEYAVFQDQGTSTLPANDFTGKGFDKELPGIVDSLLGVVTKGLG